MDLKTWQCKPQDQRTYGSSDTSRHEQGCVADHIDHPATQNRCYETDGCQQRVTQPSNSYSERFETKTQGRVDKPDRYEIHFSQIYLFMK